MPGIDNRFNMVAFVVLNSFLSLVMPPSDSLYWPASSVYWLIDNEQKRLKCVFEQYSLLKMNYAQVEEFLPIYVQFYFFVLLSFFSLPFTPFTSLSVFIAFFLLSFRLST